MSADAERRIIEFIESNQQAETEFLAQLVHVASDNPPGDCAAHAERAAELLEKLGFTVERHGVPSAEVEANGMISVTNLIVRRSFGEGPTIVLNAHGDVVPPGDGWSVDPYGAEIRGGWMYGRGVAVSKSDFATYVFALLALEAADAPLHGSVEMHFTYDEEAGGNIGPKWLLEKNLTNPDYSIGAGFSYAVVTAHNGCLHLELDVRGKSAHAALPATGNDALEAANGIMSALYEERRGYDTRVSDRPGIGSPQMTIGLISGGINTNVVPDRVVLRLDRRVVPEEDLGQVEGRLRTIIREAATGFDGITVEIRQILLAEPLTELAGSERLSEVLCRRAEQVLGCPVAPTGVPLYTDARHYTARGIATVLYGAGPRSIEEANAHRADERLLLADLFGATKVVALALLDMLGA